MIRSDRFASDMKERRGAARVQPNMEDRALIERIARHLARHDSEDWQSHVPDAASILALMKEPDVHMREEGDGEIWRSMIDAALRQRWTVAPGTDGDDSHGGADEEGEIRLGRDAVSHDRADWVHVHGKKEDKQ